MVGCDFVPISVALGLDESWDPGGRWGCGMPWEFTLVGLGSPPRLRECVCLPLVWYPNVPFVM